MRGPFIAAFRKTPIGTTSNVMITPSITIHKDDLPGSLPPRCPVAMYCVIAAEVGIFTIYAVAYIFYIGKSVNGPQPRDVLHLPIFLAGR